MDQRLRQWSPLASLALAGLLTVVVAGPAGAIVRFEPSPEPVPERWLPDTTVAVPWAGVSLTVPPTWRVNVKSEPATGLEAGASLLSAFGPGDTMCTLHVFDPERVETWQDVGVKPTATLTIAGHDVERFDDMLGTGAPISSAYSVHAGGYVYSLLCHADQAPVDRWLSIAETLEVAASTPWSVQPTMRPDTAPADPEGRSAAADKGGG